MDDYTDDYLVHYGVKGMKWGIRKDPERTYHKAMGQLKKTEDKISKQQRKSLKRDVKASRKMVKAARYQAKGRQDERAKSSTTKAVKAYSNAARSRRKLAKSQLRAARRAKNINKAFEGVTIKTATKEERQLGQRYMIDAVNYARTVSIDDVKHK